jgi:hypothetical protein
VLLGGGAVVVHALTVRSFGPISYRYLGDSRHSAQQRRLTLYPAIFIIM